MAPGRVRPGASGSRQLHGLDVGIDAESQGPDESNVATAGGDVVVMHGEADVCLLYTSPSPRD